MSLSMANGMIPPNKAKIKIALNYLEEEGFAGWAKQKIKERLFELDLVAVDPDMIASEVITARADAIPIDWFLNQLKAYKIGRASCRERMCQYVKISEVTEKL